MRKYRRMEVRLKLVLLLMAILLSVSATETRGSHAEAPVTEQILNQVVNSLRMFVDELPQMPKIYGYSKKNGKFLPAQLTVGMFQKKWKFHRDLPATTVFSYGTSRKSATVPGPTIETLQGIATYIRWENNLPQNHILPWDPTVPTAIPKYGGVPAVVHLHGGIHEPESDGSAFAWYTAGFKETGPAWTKPTYTYPNVQQPGNLWYHDHALGLTRATLLAGLVGAYTIRNPTVETPFNLPSGDEFDRHLMVFDRSFQKDGSLYMNFTGNNPSIHPQWQPEYFGDAIIVNGKAWPFLRVQRRKYRFRIINASNARYYNFRLSNGLPFIHVGSDSTYLSSPVTSTSILLAPSEIADIIIDFSLSEQNEIILINDARYPYPAGKPTGTLDGNIMKFIISFQTPNPLDSSTIPSKLVNYTIAREEEAIKRRYIAMYEYLSSSGSPTHLYINGKRLEDPVTEKPKSGSVEVWEVINLTGDDHPLHLHLANFQAIRSTQLVNISTFKTCMQTVGDPVKCHVKAHATGKVFDIRPYERTWKNGVKIPPGHMTTIVVKFKLVENDAPYPFDATAKPGYVYHCHILDHEDNAMIRPMHLVP